MNRDGASPRRRPRSVAAALPAALLLSVLLAAPVVSSPLAAPAPFPTTVQPAAPARPNAGSTLGLPAGSSAAAAATTVRPRAAAPSNLPRWSVSRGALGVLVLSYVGIGALAAAGIWSYVRRGRW